MKILFSQEMSSEVHYLSSLILELQNIANNFFQDRIYGKDLVCIYLGIFCMNDRFAAFFPSRRPKYQNMPKKLIHKGVEVIKQGKSLSFELRLNFDVYKVKDEDTKLNLAKDILKSFEVINDVKAIKDFDNDSFKSDFFDLFKKINWLEK